MNLFCVFLGKICEIDMIKFSHQFWSFLNAIYNLTQFGAFQKKNRDISTNFPFVYILAANFVFLRRKYKK